MRTTRRASLILLVSNSVSVWNADGVGVT